MVWGSSALGLFAAIGAASVARIGYKSIRTLKLGGFGGKRVDLAAFRGSWAVVTGASDGIGAEYAKQLGANGCNLLLISRTENKLKTLAAQLRVDNPNIDVQIIAVDLAKDLPITETFKSIEESLNNIEPVGILVNNVAVNYPYPQYYATSSLKEDEDIVRVNITTSNRLTKLVLPKMLHNKKGAVINLSSLTGTMPSPLLNVYSSTKAYMEHFSKNLHAEYAKEGITCQCVTPGLVATKMSQATPSLLVCKPDVVVKNSLNNLGSPRIVPYFFHRVCEWLAQNLPESFVAQKMLAFNLSINETATKKRAMRDRKRGIKRDENPQPIRNKHQ